MVKGISYATFILENESYIFVEKRAAGFESNS